VLNANHNNLTIRWSHSQVDGSLAVSFLTVNTSVSETSSLWRRLTQGLPVGQAAQLWRTQGALPPAEPLAASGSGSSKSSKPGRCVSTSPILRDFSQAVLLRSKDGKSKNVSLAANTLQLPGAALPATSDDSAAHAAAARPRSFDRFNTIVCGLHTLTV